VSRQVSRYKIRNKQQRKACGQHLLLTVVTMCREVDVDERMRMDPRKLEEMILEDKAKGNYEKFEETVT
jgi:hypothetical protein